MLCVFPHNAIVCAFPYTTTLCVLPHKNALRSGAKGLSLAIGGNLAIATTGFANEIDAVNLWGRNVARYSNGNSFGRNQKHPQITAKQAKRRNELTED
jgi:hypothetical protein